MTENGINLSKYFERIDYSGQTGATAETLRALHLAHTTHVPFENLDVLLGRPIRLDLPSIQQKIVGQRRGGYCFEQNGLFSAVLEQLGFQVTRLAARVRIGTTKVLPRTHMLLKVEADGRSWIADVGFGGWGLLEPIPFEADRENQQGVWSFRLVQEGHAWVLQCPQSTLGLDQYAFTLDPFLPVDYELPNHYCATHPDSRFVQTLTAQRAYPTERFILRNLELTRVTGEGVAVEALPNEESLLRILATRFNLSFPADTSFPPTRSRG